MKRLLNIFFIALAFTLCLSSCKKDDDGVDNTNYGPISVTAAYYNTTKSDEQIDPDTGARLGTMIRLEGVNFQGIKAIYCNGVQAYINPNYLTSNSVIFRIPSLDENNKSTPVGEECDEGYRDIIWIYSNGNDPYPYHFHIMGSAPSITEISHTIPTVDSWVTVTGSSLAGISEVYFCNDLDEIVYTIGSDRIRANDGTSFQFQMPELPEDYEGGYIVAYGDNGKAASPNYFYRKKLIFLSKFYSEPDDGLYAKNPYAVKTSYYAWGSNTSGNMPDSENYPDIPEIFPAEGDGPKNPEVYRSMPDYPGAAVSVLALNDGEHSADGGACIARACFNSDACAGRSLGLAQSLDIGVELFNEATPMESLAFQFDFYIPQTWDSGRISVTYVDAGIKFMANYHPWTKDDVTYANGMTEWRTATIPMSDFPNFAGQTYAYLFKATTKDANGDYANQGFIAFYNDECDGKAAHAYDNFIMYWNNLRVVPMVTPTLEED